MSQIHSSGCGLFSWSTDHWAGGLPHLRTDRGGAEPRFRSAPPDAPGEPVGANYACPGASASVLSHGVGAREQQNQVRSRLSLASPESDDKIRHSRFTFSSPQLFKLMRFEVSVFLGFRPHAWLTPPYSRGLDTRLQRTISWLMAWRREDLITFKYTSRPCQKMRLWLESMYYSSVQV